MFIPFNLIFPFQGFYPKKAIRNEHTDLCTRTGPGALGRARGIGSRGRWEGGLGWGIHVNPWLIHVNV